MLSVFLLLPSDFFLFLVFLSSCLSFVVVVVVVVSVVVSVVKDDLFCLPTTD